MKKSSLIGLLLVIILAVIGYFIWPETSKQGPISPRPNQAIDTSGNQYGDTTPKNSQTSPVINIKTVSTPSPKTITRPNNSIPSNWKTYTNDKLGFTFQYPGSWSKYGEDANIGDRSGNIVAIKINFIDTVSQTTLLIDYHLAPKGAELYQYALSQYESFQGWYAKGGKQIVVAGNKAIEAFTTMSIDGREKALNPPLRFILVDFLDKQQTGAIELQFKTPLPGDDIEVAKFRQLLSTFKFTS